ncbi:MAG: metallophosphoesterase family protein [Candidatus Nitrosotenuis sp.]
MSYFFSADLHAFHRNIIKYARRPFNSVEEMNETILKNWNSRVKSGDNVYIIGDVSFGHPDETESFIKKLNGNLFLVKGNHDRVLRGSLTRHFEWVKDLAEITVPDVDHPRGKQKIVMCHYAMKVWNQSHYGSWHCYGHSHGTLPDDPNSLSMDVGVDCNNFFPFSYEEIKNHMSKKTFVPADRHGRYKNSHYE